MIPSPPSRRLIAGLALAVEAALWSAPAAAVEPPGRRPENAGVASWLEGPVRWLLTPDEARRLRRLRTGREAIAFLEEFWKRRDPTPEDRANPFAEQFQQRVEAADNLYPEGGMRGCMTDRGRALVLLGPPPLLRYEQQEVPAWQRGRDGDRPARETRRVVVESWVYPRPELPASLAALVDGDPEVKVVFVVEPRRAYLVAGERYLELAARAALREQR
ncbi:MAG TPA: GWxTD domain-containing protein [Thermoanaerobaculia bacterium]|nr:GWxTD domain-containing protein [Thermoanaerobaculia bacterium]